MLCERFHVCFAIVLGATASLVGMGCAPGCWAHDPDTPSCPRPQAKYGTGRSYAEISADYQRDIVQNSEPCARREPSACERVARAKILLSHPAAEIEQAIVAACEAGLGRALEGDGVRPCRRIGRLAEDRKEHDHALAAYQRGCVLGDAAACLDAGRLDPDHMLEHTHAACRFGDAPACVVEARALLDPSRTSSDVARGWALLVEACTQRSSTEACAIIGEAEARRWQ